jgi:hypothetical protein
VRVVSRFQTFDAAPLLRQAVLAVQERPVTGERVAEVLGTSLRQVRRWQAGARLQEETADRAAVALGLHPVMLWPDWYGAPRDPDEPVRVGRRRGFMRWRGRSIEVRVYAGHRQIRTATARWRGSREATEYVAEVLLERLLLELDEA